MSEDRPPPRGIPFIVGLVCLVMGALILGAQAGIVPTDGGTFFAPPGVIITLGAGLILVALVAWIPSRSPAVVRGALGLLVMLAIAVVCNWTAFAHGVRYTSSYGLGTFSAGGEDPVGGRIVFGLVALLVDAILIGWLVSPVRRVIRRRDKVP